MIKKYIKKYRELITYVVFGVLTTAVSLGSFKLFDLILGSDKYLISNILSWILAVIFAYVTNKLWVFRSLGRDLKLILREVGEFFSARLFSLAVEEAGLWLLIDCLSVGTWSVEILSFTVDGNFIAKLILQFAVVVLNYVFSKFIVFRVDRKER